MTETGIQNAIRLALSAAGVISFRNNVGAAHTADGRFIKFGVGDAGGSDLICITPVKITQDMVGQTLGIFTALEIKTKNGRLRKQQRIFLDAIKKQGGYAGVARSVEDALKIINKL